MQVPVWVPELFAGICTRTGAPSGGQSLVGWVGKSKVKMKSQLGLDRLAKLFNCRRH